MTRTDWKKRHNRIRLPPKVRVISREMRERAEAIKVCPFCEIMQQIATQCCGYRVMSIHSSGEWMVEWKG